LKSIPVDTKTKCSCAQHKELLSSDFAKWRSLSVRVTESPPYREARETFAEADPSIYLILNRTFRIEHLSYGQWRGITYTKGTGVLNPAGQSRFLRYDVKGQRALGYLRLPQDTVDFVARQVQKPGIMKSSLSDVPFLDDPVITNFGFSLVSRSEVELQSFTLKRLRAGSRRIFYLAHRQVSSGISPWPTSVFLTAALRAYWNTPRHTCLSVWTCAFWPRRRASAHFTSQRSSPRP
jgi:hypothetical protein